MVKKSGSFFTIAIFAVGAVMVLSAACAAECFAIGAAEYSGMVVTGLGFMVGAGISAMTGGKK